MESARKVALVTGASSGIGRAAALALARDGYAVALAARRADRLSDAAGEIRRSGGVAEVFATDLLSQGAAASLVSQVVSRLGRIDVLINNAGWGYCSPADKMPDQEARKMFDLNLLVPFLMIRESLPHLRRSRGVIINVSSGSGLVPSPYYAAYAATKAGLIALSDAVRLEERLDDPAGVRVVSVCPGPVRTEFGEAAGGAPVRADTIGIRVQSAEEIATLIARQARRPGRTVATSAIVWLGSKISCVAPRVMDRLVLRWARKVRHNVFRAFSNER